MSLLSKSASFASLLLPFVCSCAAMFSGVRGDVRFFAVPSEGTTVIVGEKTQRIGKECKVSKRTRSVTFRNKKFGDVVVPMARKLDWDYVLLDVLFTPGFGLVGVSVDWPTAAWCELPETVFLNFSTGEVRQLLDREVLESNVRD